MRYKDRERTEGREKQRAQEKQRGYERVDKRKVKMVVQLARQKRDDRNVNVQVVN